MSNRPDMEGDSETPQPASSTSEPFRFGEGHEALLDLDSVFSALAHPRRRYLFYSVVNDRSTDTLPELARKLAAFEQDKPLDEVTEDERRRVHVSLYHSHIPALAAHGILEYDYKEDTIIPARNIEQVQAVLDGASGELDVRQEAHARAEDD